MNRRSRFVPSFDHLGLRITPSDVAPVPSGVDYADEVSPEDLGIPGGDMLISDSITFIPPSLEEQQADDADDSIMTNVDWILPTG
ncbi:hypothetical protein TA3x_004400 [Tundrisphaera sp. TA3]|uniref:hypothetical protein n=1 Tax=Tundrisphaera sp. TA3 TaxID=3435775 RepID=UPI003EBD829E